MASKRLTLTFSTLNLVSSTEPKLMSVKLIFLGNLSQDDFSALRSKASANSLSVELRNNQFHQKDYRKPTTSISY